ncbi:response regulator [Flavobacterium subsaxonicum]|uniref:LuxR family transcriptional regulator n=1 Tax=Flavobacterium subsaxonicum WB 4.1-42 = DSM 21790 TaxID=1121898 RepID=A0A0A2MMM8_9FLAO|nr:response regulator transcription factor [Flavobacterium subsaxonicum]KGO93917.1 hypothetical protein Q766_05910 [Flavobacterium subsaxonicum WB 4.1-42 = DSM 21790]
MRIAVADDHHLIVSGLETLVNKTPYMQFVGKYQTGEALKRDLGVIKPDVLILDYYLPDQTGTQLARFISYYHPEIKMLILTGYDKPGLADEIFGSGCMGYLLKSTADSNSILEAINHIYDGRMYIDNALKVPNQEKIKLSAEAEARPHITKREVEILKHIASEYSNSEIATKLYISKRTVDNHRNSLMIKSGAKNTVGLIKFAMELNLI